MQLFKVLQGALVLRGYFKVVQGALALRVCYGVLTLKMCLSVCVSVLLCRSRPSPRPARPFLARSFDSDVRQEDLWSEHPEAFHDSRNRLRRQPLSPQLPEHPAGCMWLAFLVSIRNRKEHES